MTDTKDVYYIGRNFYFDSGTIMSSLALKDGPRYCWGDVERDLKNGITVIIRPATDKELLTAYQRLETIKKELGQ